MFENARWRQAPPSWISSLVRWRRAHLSTSQFQPFFKIRCLCRINRILYNPVSLEWTNLKSIIYIVNYFCGFLSPRNLNNLQFSKLKQNGKFYIFSPLYYRIDLLKNTHKDILKQSDYRQLIFTDYYLFFSLIYSRFVKRNPDVR